MKNLSTFLFFFTLLCSSIIHGQVVNTTPVNLVGSSDPIPGPGPFIEHPFTPSPLTGTYHGGVFYGATKEKWGYEISDLTPGEEYTLTVYYMMDRVFGTPAYDRVGDLSLLSGAVLDVAVIPYVPEVDWRNWYTMDVTFTAITATDRIDIEADGATDNSLWLFTDMSISGGGACDELETVVSATEICLGEELTLSATSTNGGTITWDDGVEDGVAFIPESPGIITYTATSSDDADCIFTVDVTVNDLPTVTATADATTVCEGDDLTLSGTGAATYVWDDGVVDGVAFEPVSTATYTVVGTDANGCENTDDITVNVAPLPVIDAGLDVTICEEESITLNGAGAGAGGTYTWDGGITDGVSFIPATSGTYTVTGTDENGCENTDEVLVTVNPLPVIDAGENQTICFEESVTLSGSGAGLGDLTSWSDGVIDGMPFTPESTTTYTYTAISPDGCESTDEVTVTVNPLPDVIFTADDQEGCTPFPVRFTSGTSDGASYVWNFGDGDTGVGFDVSHTYVNEGLYDVTLTVTSTEGCVASDTYTDYINVVDPPLADFTASTDEEVDFNTVFEFGNESTGATSYVWDFGDGSAPNIDNSPIHEFPTTTAGTYTVTLTATNDIGCTSVIEKQIEIKNELVFYIPNAFTPDGDDLNRTFQPVFTSGLDVYDYHLTIFNRWGEIVFESFNANNGWDGTYGNKGLVEDGSYVWLIEFGETMSDKKHVEKGNVIVIR
jgi:gliding motility-associated-like protein